MDDLLSRISTVLERQDFRMCVPPESDDTDIVLEECRNAVESLRQQLAAALAACEARSKAIESALFDHSLDFHVSDSSIIDLKEALTIKPDATALDQHTAQMRNDFCAAINHAISLGVEGSEFLRCWNEGNWKGCAEFGFTPSDTLKGTL